jgi:hypothetical protein
MIGLEKGWVRQWEERKIGRYWVVRDGLGGNRIGSSESWQSQTAVTVEGNSLDKLHHYSTGLLRPQRPEPQKILYLVCFLDAIGLSLHLHNASAPPICSRHADRCIYLSLSSPLLLMLTLPLRFAMRQKVSRLPRASTRHCAAPCTPNVIVLMFFDPALPTRSTWIRIPETSKRLPTPNPSCGRSSYWLFLLCFSHYSSAIRYRFVSVHYLLLGLCFQCFLPLTLIQNRYPLVFPLLSSILTASTSAGIWGFPN